MSVSNRDQLILLGREYKALTGTDYYLYTSRPGDGQVRVVFTDGVIQGIPAALDHMRAKLAQAQAARAAGG